MSVKFNRKTKKLAIPAGINPNISIEKEDFYNTSDADIVASDVIEGKIGYGKDGKIVGTLNIESEKEESYQDGVNDGREEIIAEQSDATITPQTVFKGEVGYGKNNERIIGEYESLDFSGLGYTSEDVNRIYQFISDDIAQSVNFMNDFDGTNSIFNGTSTIKYFGEIDCYIFRNKTSPQLGSNDSLRYISSIINVTNTSTANMFQYNPQLYYVPYFDTSKVKSMYSMFEYCTNLRTIPEFNTSSVTSMERMLSGCESLTTIPNFDTSNVTNMSYMLAGCTNLTTIPEFNTSKVTNYYCMFNGCKSLKNLHELNGDRITGASYGSTATLTTSNTFQLINFGGFKDLGKNYKSNTNSWGDIDLEYMSSLTHESCMNVINKAYDMNLNTQNTYTPKIRFHATPYALLSDDDIAIATAKGWTVQAG